MEKGKARKRSRHNGEGWLKKRSDGKGYDVGLHIPMPDGTLKRKSTTKKKFEDADRWLTQQKKDRDGGVFLSDENPKLSEYLAEWLENSVRGSVKAVTYKHYKRMVENHVNPVLGGIKIKALTARDVQRLHGKKFEEGLAVSTRRHVHTTLKKALSQAVAWGDIPSNPAASVKPPKGRAEGSREREQDVQPFSEEELARLLEATKGHRLHALYVFAPSTGLREQELCALKWADIELPEAGKGAVRVRRAVVETEKGFEIAETKTKGSRRRVEFPASVAAVLRAHRKAQVEERLRAPEWTDHGLVFPNARGDILTRFRLGAHFRKVRQRSGIDQRHQFRDLRHTYATLLFARKAHPKLVQMAMGHASINITLDTYTHWIPGVDGGLAETIEDVFSS